MLGMGTEVLFKIDSWTPSTLPMERLGQYLVELSALYGEKTSVHFRRLRKGSAILVSLVDAPAVPKVRERISRARRYDAPAEIGQAFDKIDRMLADDNARGTVRLAGEESTIIAFPGRDRERPIDYGPVRQQGFLDGEIVRIGGRDSSVHLQLQDGDTLYSHILTDRDTARRLGSLIFGPTVRLHGVGSWRRTEAGDWQLDSFRVSDFEQLNDEENLHETLGAIAAVGGSQWHEAKDPLGDLIRSRRDTPPGKGEE
jgi:hypothetical protein